MCYSFVLSCCSTADLKKSHFEQRDVHYVCFHYKLDGQEYADDLGESIPFQDFYQRLSAGSESSTSQVNISEYLEYFEQFLQKGLDILHVCFSSGLSGTYNSAMNAKLIAEERWPDRKIRIIDSLCASSGYGLLMDQLADLRDSGISFDELADWAENNKLRVNHLFFSTDLSFYVKGGRVSRAAGILGGVLNICPYLDMNNEGKLVLREKLRGKKQVIKHMVKKMLDLADQGADYDGKCYLSHSACLEDAEAVVSLIETAFPNIQKPVLINDVGTTIGSHTGPGTVALFFWGKERSAR